MGRRARVDPQLLSPIKHRSERGQRALLRIKVREALVRSRVNQVNSVRFLLKSLGVVVASGTKALTFTRRLRPTLDEATRVLVEPLLTMIDALNAKIAVLDEELDAFGREQYPATLRLLQVPGVCPLTALAFVLTIEDPTRFPQTRAVGAYLGLVPRRSQSGNTDKQLPITKAGNVQLRCLLVNCAHYILGPFGPPSHLRETGERLAARWGQVGEETRGDCRRAQARRHAPGAVEERSRLRGAPRRSMKSFLQVTSLGHCDVAIA